MKEMGTISSALDSDLSMDDEEVVEKQVEKP